MKIVINFLVLLFCLAYGHAQSVPTAVLELEARLNTIATPNIFEADRLAARYEAKNLLLKDSLTISAYYDLPMSQVVRVFNNLDMTDSWSVEDPAILVEVTSAEVCVVNSVQPMSTGRYLLRATCSLWNKNIKGKMTEISRTAVVPSPVVEDILIGNFGLHLHPRFAYKPTSRRTTLPDLDWPPPLATVQGEIAPKLFGPINQYQHADRLESVLATYGYLSTFRFDIEGQRGISIMTTPERIHRDGSAYLEKRFVNFTPGAVFSLSRITESLRFFAEPGTYRVWLLAIQEIETGKFRVSPYVYLFEVPEPTTREPDPDVRLVLSHLLTYDQHLEKSGWIRLLRGY